MENKLFTNGFTFFAISSIVTIVLSMIVDAVAKKLTNAFNQKHSDKITTNQYLYHTIRLAIWLVCAIVIIRQIEPLKSLGDTILGATSIIAVAVGIAAQATFGNYIAGFFLAVHQPFRVGDIIYIKERGISGTVKEINFRHTVLLTQEQTEIIIPNTFMNTAVIEDMSNGNYSQLFELKVSGDCNLDKLQKIIDKLLDEEKLVHKQADTKLIVKGMDKNGFDLAFPIHTDSLSDYVEVKNSFIPKLYKELKKNKITLI